jgi:hypothetical protein
MEISRCGATNNFDFYAMTIRGDRCGKYTLTPSKTGQLNSCF